MRRAKDEQTAGADRALQLPGVMASQASSSPLAGYGEYPTATWHREDRQPDSQRPVSAARILRNLQAKTAQAGAPFTLEVDEPVHVAVDEPLLSAALAGLVFHAAGRSVAPLIVRMRSEERGVMVELEAEGPGSASLWSDLLGTQPRGGAPTMASRSLEALGAKLELDGSETSASVRIFLSASESALPSHVNPPGA